MSNFTPTGTTKNISATTTSASVALPVYTTPRTVRVYNATAGIVFVEFGGASVAAVVATSMPLGPGATEFFDLGGATTYAAAIMASGAGTVYFTEGQGS